MLERFLILRERNAIYGLEDEFYVFYNKIITLSTDVLVEAENLRALSTEYSDRFEEEFVKEDNRIKEIIYFKSGDRITTDLEKDIKKLQDKYRKKIKKSL